MSSAAFRIGMAAAARQFKPKAPPSPGIMAICNADRAAPTSSAYFSRTGNLNDWFASDLPKKYPIRLCYDAKRQSFVVVSPDLVNISRNGLKFEADIKFPSSVGNVVDMAIFNATGSTQGRWVALTKYGGAWYSDDEGATWTKSNLPSPLASGNNEYVRARYTSYHNRVYVTVDGTTTYYTNDGITYTAMNTVTAGRWVDVFWAGNAGYPGGMVMIAAKTAANKCWSANSTTWQAAATLGPTMTPATGDAFRGDQMAIARDADTGTDIYSGALNSVGLSLLAGGSGPSGHVRYVPAQDTLYDARFFGGVQRKVAAGAFAEVLPVAAYWGGLEYGALVGY